MVELRLPGVLQPGVGLRRRVAGAGWAGAVAAGPGSAPGDGRRGTASEGPGAQAGRGGRALRAALLFVDAADAQVLASRIWPSPEYTRVTIESKSEPKFTVFSLKDPERVVLDLEAVEISPALAELQNKLTAEDPYV